MPKGSGAARMLGYAGNQAMQSLLGARARRTASAPRSPEELEREAEAVASRLTQPRERARETGIPGPLVTGRARPAGPALRDDLQAVARSLGRAHPLGADTRRGFEAGFGVPLDRVRIHDGPAAARATRLLGLRAFTIGHQLAFAEGRYAPHSLAGRRLLAHELAHLVQQGAGGGPGSDARGSPVPAIALHGARAEDVTGMSITRRFAEQLDTCGLMTANRLLRAQIACLGESDPLRTAARANLEIIRGVAATRGLMLPGVEGQAGRPRPPGGRYPAAPNAWQGIDLEPNVRSRVPIREGMFSGLHGVVTSGIYRITPYLINADDPHVVYYEAVNTQVNRTEFIIGPAQLDDFVSNTTLYRFSAGHYFGVFGVRPHETSSSQAALAMMQGDLGEAFSALGRSWRQALGDLSWWTGTLLSVGGAVSSAGRQATRPATRAPVPARPAPRAPAAAAQWETAPMQVNASGQMVQLGRHVPTGQIYRAVLDPRTGQLTMTHLASGRTATASVVTGRPVAGPAGLLPSGTAVAPGAAPTSLVPTTPLPMVTPRGIGPGAGGLLPPGPRAPSPVIFAAPGARRLLPMPLEDELIARMGRGGETGGFSSLGPVRQIPVGREGPTLLLEGAAGRTRTRLGVPIQQGLMERVRTDILGRISPRTTIGTYVGPDGVSRLLYMDATRRVPEAFRGQFSTIMINNPRGFVPNLAHLREALRPGGRIIIQGTALPPNMTRSRRAVGTAVIGGRQQRMRINPDFQDLWEGRASPPAGLRLVPNQEVRPGVLEIAQLEPLPFVPRRQWPNVFRLFQQETRHNILGTGFRTTGGDRSVMPNARIVFERVGD